MKLATFILLVLSASIALGEDVARFDGDESPVYGVDFHSDQLITFGKNLARSWDYRSKSHKQLIINQSREMRNASIVGDYMILGIPLNGTIEVLRFDGTIAFELNKMDAAFLVSSPRHKLVALRASGADAHVYRLQDDGKLVRGIKLVGTKHVRDATFSANSFVGLDGNLRGQIEQIQVWPTEAKDEGEEVRPKQRIDGDEERRYGAANVPYSVIDCAELHLLAVIGSSRDGKKYRGMIDFWDTRDWSYRRTLQLSETGFANCIAVSPNGSSLAVGGDWAQPLKVGTLMPREERFEIKLYDTKTFEQVRTLRGHRECVQCLRFSPDGDYLASGSDDKSAIVWAMSPKK